MDIATDAFSAGFVTGAASKTIAHTCSGSNIAICVSVTGDSTDIINDVTWDGSGSPVSLVRVFGNQGGSGGALWYYGYARANMTAGSGNIVITASGTSAFILGAVGSYTGVGSIEAFDHVENGGASGSISVDVNTITDNAWTVLMASAQGGSPGAGSGSIKRIDDNFGSIGVAAIFDSGGPIHPTANYSMTFTQTSNANYGAVIVSMAPSTGGPTIFAPPHYPRGVHRGISRRVQRR